MKRLRYIWLVLFLALLSVMPPMPVMAQNEEPTSAAGKDFYFTLFDHWGWSGYDEAHDAQTNKYCGLTVCATEAGDMTLSVPTSTGDKHFHFDAYNYLAASLRNANDAVLQGVHIHSTANCYIHVWAHGRNAGDETMILPKHLLGKKYMLQGIEGTLYHSEPNPIPTYSQFTVVGTENYTSVVVTPKVQLVCVSRNNAIIPAGRPTGLYILENEVLLFQPEDYTNDISGTLVESDKVVAVFQGNNYTNMEGITGGDFVWEQARPVSSWGKEFIVAKSTRTPNALCRLTALYDNTEVYYYMAGNKYLLKNLSAGESVEGTSISPVEHFVCTQPACCYLYTTSSSQNNNVGDPSMTEIIPVDNMATETRWMLEQVDDNTPWSFSLLVTTRLEDEAKVKYNNTPLSSFQPDGDGVFRTVTDGFVTYEMGISAYMASKITAEDGAGFSAYILRIGKIAEASTFNISMPHKLPPPELCPDGVLLFREDFGGNDPNDPVAGTDPVPGMSSTYQQIYDTANCTGKQNCVGMGSGRYLLTKVGYRNASGVNWSHWFIMDDHTHPDDYSRGYLLEIDGRSYSHDVFYETTLEGLCEGLELSFSAYVANVSTTASYKQGNTGCPKLTFTITNPQTEETIASYTTDTIGHDWTYAGRSDEWRNSAQWQLVGMNFVIPPGTDAVKLSISNSPDASAGNDFAIDDIEVYLCAPPVDIDVPDTVYAGDKITMTGEFVNDDTFIEPLEYQWFFSNDSANWTAIDEAIVKDWTTVAYDGSQTGWYRLAVYSAGKRGSNCSTMSAPKKMVVLPPILCSDGQLVYFQQSTGSWALFHKTLSGFCAGTKISFSVVTQRPVRLALYDATDDTELTHFEEDVDTPVRPHKVGLNYIIPDGISDITFVTSNGFNANADSFEVRLCVPTITIEAPDTVCIDTKNIFHAQFENDGSFAEPLVYQWYFSPDSVTWTPAVEGNAQDLKIKAKMRHAGWYKVAVADNEHIDNENCRATSAPHRFYVIEDCPPILCPEGVLLLHEDLTGNETSYSTDITGLCANMDLSLIVNLAPGHAAGRMMLRLTDIDTGHELRVYDTGDYPSDSMQVGTTFTVPEGVSNVRWTINRTDSNANPLGIENIEVRLCLEPISVGSVNPACRKKPHTFSALYDNYGILESPEYQWAYSADSINWTALQTGTSKLYTIPVVHKSDEGWYKVTVANAGNMEHVNCREESEPFKLETRYCNTAVEQYVDTTVCDTLMPVFWRGHEWPAIGTLVDTLTDIDEDDSVYVHKTLQTVVCCPDIRYIPVDSAICDTLMPFLWLFRDTMLLFEDIGEQEVQTQHYKWENCIGSVYTLALDTFHCERLYPIIVNKYNWQLLLDYVTLSRIFPERQYLAFQWYKNDEPIPGAIDDDYAEQNELCGLFQLRIQLDEAVDNHDEYIWSNILEIGEAGQPQPVIKRIYNWSGILMSEESLPRGVYLIRYEQGDKIWTEKILIP